MALLHLNISVSGAEKSIFPMVVCEHTEKRVNKHNKQQADILIKQPPRQTSQ